MCLDSISDWRLSNPWGHLGFFMFLAPVLGSNFAVLTRLFTEERAPGAEKNKSHPQPDPESCFLRQFRFTVSEGRLPGVEKQSQNTNPLEQIHGRSHGRSHSHLQAQLVSSPTQLAPPFSNPLVRVTGFRSRVCWDFYQPCRMTFLSGAEMRVQIPYPTAWWCFFFFWLGKLKMADPRCFKKIIPSLKSTIYTNIL